MARRWSPGGQSPTGQASEGGVDLEIRLMRDRVGELHRDYGDDFLLKVVKPIVRVEVGSALPADTDRSEPAVERLSGEIMERVNGKLRPLGAELTLLAVANVSEGGMRSYGLERGEGIKLFVLGPDGYDWIVMEKVAESVDLPNINKLRREGAWGKLESIEPLVSPLIWTTMATGVTPDIHGITDFLVRDEATGKDIPVTSSMRRMPAVWNMVSLFDPNWVKGARRPSSGMTYPAGLYDEIDQLDVGPEGAESHMSLYIRGPINERSAGQDRLGLQAGQGPPDPESSLRQIISAYRTYERVMKKLYSTYRPDLFGVYFEFTDSVCHLFMRCMKPAMDGVTGEEAERYGGAIAATYGEADRILGDVLDMLDDETVLLVVSDHAFKSGDFRPLSDS